MLLWRTSAGRLMLFSHCCCSRGAGQLALRDLPWSSATGWRGKEHSKNVNISKLKRRKYPYCKWLLNNLLSSFEKVLYFWGPELKQCQLKMALYKEKRMSLISVVLCVGNSQSVSLLSVRLRIFATVNNWFTVWKHYVLKDGEWVYRETRVAITCFKLFHLAFTANKNIRKLSKMFGTSTSLCSVNEYTEGGCA